jgi:putative hydrolase of the HAD superfamily
MSKLGDRESIIFDLDDTLIVEVAVVEAAFLATCERCLRRTTLTHEKYGTDTHKLYHAVKSSDRQLWNAFPNIDYCNNSGIGSWEGLWGNFDGNDRNLKFLHEHWCIC